MLKIIILKVNGSLCLGLQHLNFIYVKLILFCITKVCQMILMVNNPIRS